MAFVKRLSNLLTADAHAVLDLIEEPYALLKQALRDMDSAIENQQKTLFSMQNQQTRLSSLLTKIHHDIATINDDLDLCFEAKNLDLAKSLVKKKLTLKQQSDQLECSIKTLRASIIDFEKQLDDHLSKYESMRLKAEVFEAQQQSVDHLTGFGGVDFKSADYAASCASRSNYANFTQISEDDIEIALLNEQKSRSAS